MKWQQLGTALLILLLGANAPGAANRNTDRQTANESVANAPEAAAPVPENSTDAQDAVSAISLSIDGREFTVTLADTEASREFVQLLPMTIEMNELNRNEKYYYLPENLSADGAYRPDTMQAGDLMCWSGNCLVLFYETFANSYGGYVRLGTVDDISGLQNALGTGSAVVHFEIP